MKKRLLVLGGSGFIGFNVWTRLHESYDVHIIDRKQPHWLERTFANYYSIDLKEREKLEITIKEINPHFILNLAAKSTIVDCHEKPYEAFLDNTYGNLNVLNAALKIQKSPNYSFEKLIIHSSDKAYGHYASDKLPYLETYAHFPSDIYSTSKACQDMMTISWANSLGLKATVVRSGNIYGPNDLNLSRLVPSVIDRLSKNQKPILYRGAENAVRDFVFVYDLISAYELLFEKGEVGEAYNIGGSGPIKVIHAIDTIKEVMGKKDIENDLLTREVMEFDAQYLSSEKLKSLGWKHQSTFQEGIFETVEFYNNKQKNEIVYV